MRVTDRPAALSRSSFGMLAAAFSVAAICFLYTSAYGVVRLSHVLVHREEWGPLGEVTHRVTAGDDVRLPMAEVLFSPMIMAEEAYWRHARPNG